MATLLLPPHGGTPREVANAVNAALLGKINSVGDVTLEANAVSTVVENVLVSGSSKIMLFPQTANAAAELGNGTAYIDPANIVSGAGFAITHADNAQTDRTFFYAIFG